jgi:chromosome segregation protein
LENRITAKRQDIVKLSINRDKLKSKRAEYDVQINSLNNSRVSAEESNKTARVELEKTQSRVRDTEIQLTAAKSRKADLEMSLEKFQKEYSQKGSQLRSLAKSLSEKEAEFARLNAQSEVLKQAEHTFAGYSGGAKTLLEDFNARQVDGAKGVLGEILKVPKEYEIAVGAALGEYIDGIVLQGYEDISEALSILEQKSENGALIPLGNLYPAAIKKNYGNQDGVIARASELVQVSKELNPVVEILLADTWVVEDREAAEKLLSTIRSDRDFRDNLSVKVVTRTGEVFYATGQIRTSSGSAPVSMSRPRRLKDLREKVDKLESQVTDIQKQVEEVEVEIGSARAEEIQLVKQLHHETTELEAASAAHNQEILAFDRVNRELLWREEQIQAFKEHIDTYQAKIKQTAGELELLNGQILEVQEEAEAQSEKLTSLPIDNLQADLSHWGTRLEILKQGLRTAQARRTEREQLHSAAKTRRGSIEKNILEIQGHRAELESHVENLMQNSHKIAGDIEASAASISPSETALEEIEDKLSEILRLESRERVLTSQAEQSFTQARINQIRKQEALDGLRRQIEADFGLVAFEYHDDVSGPTPLPLEGIVEDLPLREELHPDLEVSLKRQRALTRRIGPINPEAQAEYQDVSDRYEFLSSQVNDLQEASEGVQRVIAELDEIMQREFCNTFDAVAEEFRQIFGRLFGGGSAKLILTDPDDLTNTGIDIEARLPGRREQGLSLLSGGERSLTAVALVFSLLRVSPTPFCVLDEVDAMLDEANVGRFRELLRELSDTTQFIMITHNRATVQVADIIYGVTMGHDSTSKILSLKVDELEKVIK